MLARFEAEIATVGAGHFAQRFCAWHLPPTSAKPTSLVVHLHPFAEEMNKSRRMVAMQSRALAAAGHLVLRMDLLGCGDSAGDLGDAGWADWLDDVHVACRLARDRHAREWPGTATPDLWLWGQRLGCLLAVQAAAAESPCHLLFWQATPNGKQLLQQFLRLQSIGALLGKGINGRGAATDDLAAGNVVEIAGYRISPELAQGLGAARLAPVRAFPGARLEWLDMQAPGSAEPSPVVRQALADWTSAGWAARYCAVPGPAFWQTTEIEDAPALIDATMLAFTCHDAPPAAPTLLATQSMAAA